MPEPCNQSVTRGRALQARKGLHSRSAPFVRVTVFGSASGSGTSCVAEGEPTPNSSSVSSGAQLVELLEIERSDRRALLPPIAVDANEAVGHLQGVVKRRSKLRFWAGRGPSR